MHFFWQCRSPTLRRMSRGGWKKEEIYVYVKGESSLLCATHIPNRKHMEFDLITFCFTCSCIINAKIMLRIEIDGIFFGCRVAWFFMPNWRSGKQPMRKTTWKIGCRKRCQHQLAIFRRVSSRFFRALRLHDPARLPIWKPLIFKTKANNRRFRRDKSQNPITLTGCYVFSQKNLILYSVLYSNVNKVTTELIGLAGIWIFKRGSTSVNGLVTHTLFRFIM